MRSRWGIAATLLVVLGLLGWAAGSSMAQDYVAGSTAVVRATPGGTVADSGFVECSPAPAPSTGGACIPWTAGGSAIKVTDDVNGTAVAFQVCVDNDGNQQCGGTPTITGCDDDIVFSHFDSGAFSNPVAAPTSFRSGCPGGFKGWVVILCQGVHGVGSPHTHEVTKGTVTSVSGGGASGNFCGGPPFVPGKPYFIGKAPRGLCAGSGTLTTASALTFPVVSAARTATFTLTFNAQACTAATLTANGTLTGDCASAMGSGSVNGTSPFLLRLTSGVLTLTPVGPDGGLGILTIVPSATGGESCVTGADSFTVNGLLGTL